MKKTTTTWALLVAALALAATIVFIERGGHEFGRPAGSTVFDVFPESIEQIITERDGVLIECVREDGVWRMVRPVEAAVDSAIIRQMIAGMSRTERGERITPKALRARNLTPADYGFDEPRARIKFRNNRGVFTWLIGRDALLGEKVYVMRESGGEIISAPRQLYHLVPADPAWIRDRTIIDCDVPDVRGVDLVRDGTAYRIRQDGANRWVFREPFTGRANAQAVHALIELLVSGRIADFVAEERSDPDAFGLGAPRLELTVYTRDERTRTVQIGRATDEDPSRFYARHSTGNGVFTVPADWVAGFDRDPVWLRSRSLTHLPAPRVDTLRIQRAEQQVELVRTNRQWQLERPVRWEACPDRVNEVLVAVLEAPVERFVNEPSSEQTARIRSAPWQITLNAGSSSSTLRISAPDADGVRLVESAGESSLYVVPVQTVREIYADPLFYRSQLVLSISPASIRQLIIRRGDQTDEVRKLPDGTFGGGADQSAQVHAQALSDLMWLLNDLRAERFVAFNPDGLEVFGLDDPHIEVSILLEERSGVIGRVLRIGGATEGGRFAKVHGQPVVFVLPNEGVRVLAASLVQVQETGLNEE